jgi:hypothetical protein
MVDYMTVCRVENPSAEEPMFFRIVFINPKVGVDDMRMVLREIGDCFGELIKR